MLITFEGIDGCGKTTHMELLRKHLRKTRPAGEVLNTREPGFFHNDLAGLYRHLIVEASTSPLEKMFLLLADRSRHFERVIRANLLPDWRSKIILSDRGPDSTVAYQGFGQGLASIPFLVEANRIAMQGSAPDLTIVLDVDPEEGLRRAKKEQYFEGLGIDFFDRVQRGYIEIAKHEPKRVVIVDATQSKEETHALIITAVHDYLGI